MWTSSLSTDPFIVLAQRERNERARVRARSARTSPEGEPRGRAPRATETPPGSLSCSALGSKGKVCEQTSGPVETKRKRKQRRDFCSLIALNCSWIAFSGWLASSELRKLRSGSPQGLIYWQAVKKSNLPFLRVAKGLCMTRDQGKNQRVGES